MPGLLWPFGVYLSWLNALPLAFVFLLPGLKGNGHLLYKRSPQSPWVAMENVYTGGLGLSDLGP